MGIRLRQAYVIRGTVKTSLGYDDLVRIAIEGGPMHANPIYCFHPTPERAAEFAAPAYDVFDRAGAAAYVAAHPRSFLAIDRPETGFAPDHDMYADDVYEHARTLLNERVADGTLLRDENPCYYIWRLKTAGGHTQTGLVCGVAVDDYEDGTVHRHEEVLAEKAADRIRHIRTTNAQTGPIFLAYRDNPTIDALVALTTTGEPFYDFVAEDGCRHTIWRISRDVAIGSLQLMFEQVPDAYIADGHHRCASAVAVCEERRAAAREAEKTDGAAGDSPADDDPSTTATRAGAAARTTNAPGEEVAPYDRFLAVLFPASQLQIMPYDRVLTDAGGLTADEAIAAIRAAGFTVEPAEGVVDPQAHGEYGLKIEGRWYTVRLVGGRADDPAIDPVAKLDTAIAQDRILGPVFGIADPTRDSRISFVGGADAAEQADARAGQTGVALTLHATSMDQLMAVADAGKLMPPKSTWFEPKLLSGLFIRRI